jgi:hypothetical protein
MEILGIFTVHHGKVVRLIMCLIKLGFLKACIPDDDVRESTPSFLGGGDGSNKRLFDGV